MPVHANAMPSPFVLQYLTHACLKFHGDGGALICDPWLLNEPVANFSLWKFPPAAVPVEQAVAGVEWVYITHSHEDHFHIPSLDRLRRDVQMLLSDYADQPDPRADSMERALRALGFHRIRRLPAWEPMLLGTDFRFTVIPHAPSRCHGWENSGFVLEHGAHRILNLNDNVTDATLCRQLRERFGHFDLVCVQSAGLTMYPGCFRMSEAEMRAAVAARRHALGEQRRVIELLRPARLLPVGGDVCWLAEDLFHCNWANRGTPRLLEGLVRDAYPASGIEVLSLAPGDRWSPHGGVEQVHAPVDWDDYLSQIRALQERTAPKRAALEQWLADTDRNDLAERSRALTARVQAGITRCDLDFAARLRQVVELANGEQLTFTLAAAPGEPLRIHWEDQAPVDQTLYVSERVWAAILAGRMLWNDIQWVGQIEQHGAFRPEMGRFWFWLQTHLGLGNTNLQALIEPALYPPGHPIHERPVDPGRGVFNT